MIGTETNTFYNNVNLCTILFSTIIIMAYMYREQQYAQTKSQGAKFLMHHRYLSYYDYVLFFVCCELFCFITAKFLFLMCPRTHRNIFLIIFLEMCKYQVYPLLQTPNHCHIHTWICVMVSHTQAMIPDYLCCSPCCSHKQAGQQHKAIKQK